MPYWLVARVAFTHNSFKFVSTFTIYQYLLTTTLYIDLVTPLVLWYFNLVK